MKFQRSVLLDYLSEHVLRTRCLGEDAMYDGAFFDSRESEPDSIFIAMDGFRSRGVQYVISAIEKGATCVVVNNSYYDELARTLETYPTCDFIFVADSLFAFGVIGRLAREQFMGEVIGVIGSVGKTTTKNILRELGGGQLAAHASRGSYNNQTGVPLTLCAIPESSRYAIVELGESHFGDLAYITKIAQPTTVVITNVAQAHMEFLGDLAGVAVTMNETVELVPESGAIVVPIDIEHRDIVLKNAKASIIFVVDENASPDVGEFDGARIATISNVVARKDLTHDFTLTFEDITVNLHIPLVGHHFVIDAALGAVATLLSGESATDLASRMENVESQGHRMRMIHTDMLTVIDDCYNANPSSMKASMDAVAHMAQSENSRSVFVMGPMRELGDMSDDFHREVGAYASSLGIDVLICVDVATKAASDGVHKNSYFFSSVEECCEEISSIVLVGDIVGVKASRGPNPEHPTMVPIVEILSELKLSKS